MPEAPPLHSAPVTGTPKPAAQPAVAASRIIAVTSGKGGVGKTFVSANLAAALTRRGQELVEERVE